MQRFRARPALCSVVSVIFVLTGSALPSVSWAKDDTPYALVEYVMDAPEATIDSFDYIFDGDRIDLRPEGVMVVAWFDRCVVQTFRGGVIKFDKYDAKETKGGASEKTIRPCQTASVIVNAEASAAGVSVKRTDKVNSSLTLDAMGEISTAAERPLFIWPRQWAEGRKAIIDILYLEAPEAVSVWRDESDWPRFQYPDEAPALERGMPYKIVVTFDGEKKPAVETVFSIDPDLDLPPSPLGNVVPLGL